MDVFIEIIGWIGTGLVLLAYFLVSNKYLTSTGVWFQVLNLLGATGIGAYVLYLEAWPNVLLNTVWGIIAAVALYKIYKNTPTNLE